MIEGFYSPSVSRVRREVRESVALVAQSEIEVGVKLVYVIFVSLSVKSLLMRVRAA
jgi:hypothetical protein